MAIHEPVLVELDNLPNNFLKTIFIQYNKN